MENWQKRLQTFVKDINGDRILAVEDGYFNKSTSTSTTGNATTTILETCPVGYCRMIKAILITGDGNSGTAKVKIGATVVLPIYFSVMNHVLTSSGLRLRVESGEAVTVVTESRGTSETFVGITYYDMGV
jgi:hypothetical protein